MANSLFKSFEENYYEEYFKENYNQTSARKLKKNILIKKTEQGPAQLREINNSLTSNNLKIAQEFNKLPATLT